MTEKKRFNQIKKNSINQRGWTQHQRTNQYHLHLQIYWVIWYFYIMSRSTLSSFFLDGAKIIFGSLVVGAFAPSAIGGRPSLLTISFGILGTVFFLFIAEAASKGPKHLWLLWPFISQLALSPFWVFYGLFLVIRKNSIYSYVYTWNNSHPFFLFSNCYRFDLLPQIPCLSGNSLLF